MYGFQNKKQLLPSTTLSNWSQ